MCNDDLILRSSYQFSKSSSIVSTQHFDRGSTSQPTGWAILEIGHIGLGAPKKIYEGGLRKAKKQKLSSS